jgi:hypothetical protein
MTDKIEKPTLRDRFAMAALTGMLSNNRVHVDSARCGFSSLLAFKYADAMLKSREETLNRLEAGKPNTNEPEHVDISELLVSRRAWNCLRNFGIINTLDLTRIAESSLLKEPNFGRKSLNEIKHELERRGLPPIGSAFLQQKGAYYVRPND